mgnify:CR=1 FL=1
MSDRPMPPIPKGLDLTPEQVEAISGGDGCSLTSLEEISASLKQTYENLIDFTSYVIERVSTSTQ